MSFVSGEADCAALNVAVVASAPAARQLLLRKWRLLRKRSCTGAFRRSAAENSSATWQIKSDPGASQFLGRADV
jgi:hypothetical protein